MAFFEMYVDESGHSSSKPFVALGGFIAPAEDWTGFRDEWNLTLLCHGVRKGGGAGVFHMTDFEAKRGLFKGWSQEQREALLGDLFKIIDQRGLIATGFVVNVDYFHSHFVPQVDLTTHQPLEDPYHLACQGLLQIVVPYLNDVEGLAVILAQQNEYSASADYYMRAASTMYSDKYVISTTFGTPERFPHLQAADIVAFELRWRFTRPDISRWPMKQMLKKGVFMGAVPGSTSPGVRSMDDELKALGREPARKQRYIDVATKIRNRSGYKAGRKRK